MSRPPLESTRSPTEFAGRVSARALVMVLALALGGCAGAAAGRAGGGGPTEPAPTAPGAPSTLRVMPLGDSITIGFGSLAGYRLPLWALARKRDDLRIDLVGSRTVNSPPQFPDPEHEGHSRWRVRDFVDFEGDGDEPPSTIEGLLDGGRPDVVLLHAGTNDVWRPDDWFEAADDLGRLLDRAQAHDPGLGIVVAQLLPTVDPAANLAVAWLNERIARRVHERRSAGRRLRLVDMSAACPVLTTRDGVHPDHLCCEAMARAWLAALVELDAPAHEAPPPPPAPTVGVRSARVEGAASLSPLAAAVEGLDLVDGLLRAAPSGWGTPEDGAGVGPGAGAASRVGGWRSEPLPLVRGAPRPGTPATGGSTTEIAPEHRPRLVFELDGPADLTSVELWNGRGTRRAGGWAVVEALREVAVATSTDGRRWVERGVWTLVEPRGAARRPPERRRVDWRGVSRVRFEVRSTHARAPAEGDPVPRCAALSGLRFGGHPLGPRTGPGTPADGRREGADARPRAGTPPDDR